MDVPVNTARSYREDFGQAALGDDPGVLAMICDPRLNLAVWRGAAAAANNSYLMDLDISKLSPDVRWTSGYRREILNYTWPVHQLRDESRLLALDYALEDAGFPEGSGGRMDMARTIIDLVGHFAAVCKPNGGSVGTSLMAFQPSENNFWHTDKGDLLGLVTLRGAAGTWWRPDCTMRENGRDIEATPVRANDPLAQATAPGDLLLLKCRDTDQALIHASPPVPGQRLVMVMWPF